MSNMVVWMSSFCPPGHSGGLHPWPACQQKASGGGNEKKFNSRSSEMLSLCVCQEHLKDHAR